MNHIPSTHCYVGRLPKCGCVVAICVDDHNAGSDVKEFIDRGYTVERHPTDIAKEMFCKSEHVKVCKKQLLAELEPGATATSSVGDTMGGEE